MHRCLEFICKGTQLSNTTWRSRWGVGIHLCYFFNLGARWGWVVGRFTLGKETWYPLYRRLVGPKAGPDGCGKSRPPPRFDPRTIQSVASRYTAWAMPAQQRTWQTEQDGSNRNAPEVPGSNLGRSPVFLTHDFISPFSNSITWQYITLRFKTCGVT